MMMLRTPTTLLSTLLLTAFCLGQTVQEGPQVSTYQSTLDGSDQPYGLYIPPKFNPHKKYPLVISLHGAGSNHRLNLRRVFGKSNGPGESDAKASLVFPPLPEEDYIVASPLALGTMGYQGAPELEVFQVLADVEKRFPIDLDRVYLTGLSMGGGGTFWLGLTRPDIWAAIAPCCPATPAETSIYAPNGLNLPVHVFQGGADPVVNPQGTRDFVQKLKDLGTSVEYTEYPGVQHNSWENAYKDGQVFTWFSQFKRNRFPAEVRFCTDRYLYNSAYWVTIDRLTPGVPASVDAKFVSQNHVTITTSNIDALTLSLDGHAQYVSRRPLNVVIDGTSLDVTPGGQFSFSKDQGSWTNVKSAPGEGAKHRLSEGPIVDAFSTKQIYVFGTGGSPTPEELAKRRADAVQAATWTGAVASYWSGPAHITQFPVVADREVNDEMLGSANLILFGTAETNSLIAKLGDKLPVFLNQDHTDDYGLISVRPNGDHYIVIDSGLTWWSNPRAMTGHSWRIGPTGLLASLGDFVLFKNGDDHPASAGRFDNDWKLSAADASTLSASGAVTVHP
jgi:enterochelin esterase-like enzyme